MFVYEECYMERALQLAVLGLGSVQPNPMVGAVLVAEGRIIGEGWHQKYGGAHAEVFAINSVKNKELLKKSTLYVTLEPCSHFGKTPPCADLVVRMQIPYVVVGNIDPNEQVNGAGIRKLRESGAEIVTDVMAGQCNWLNRRFFTFHAQKRPYIILKWAETADGYMDVERRADQSVEDYWITNETLRLFNHKWRSEEDAILVGYNTFLNDKPQLTNRLYAGKSPKRYIMTQNPEKEDLTLKRAGFEALPESLNEALALLFEAKVQSLIVEGGKTTLERFISAGLWDEIRVLQGDICWGRGVSAPTKPACCADVMVVENNRIFIFYNSEKQ
jgi:diaminohydroxyphosphoribosylaminopyrimidine deaminase/5-amino-6-(5-phosphoribosylamino)uracil reductase